MSELNGNIQQPVQEENSLNLSDVWHLIWDFRWWYVLSVALCLIAAFLYLYVTQSTFSRTAKIIINEDVQSNVMADLITMAGGPGTDSYSSNANNEAEAFASPDLMEKVVRRLCETVQRHEAGRLVALADAEENVMACGLFVWDNNRCYSLTHGFHKTGQNVGAGKPDRIRSGLRTGNLFGFAYAVAAFVFLMAAGRYVALLFVDASETEILGNVQRMLTANSAFYIALVLVNNVRFLIQGIGYSGLAIFSGASEMVARALAGFLLVPSFGFAAVCFANPLAWVMADLFLVPAYFYLMKRTQKELGYKKPGD